MKRRLISILLAAALGAVLLAGCGDKKAEQSSSSATGGEASELTLWVTSRNTDDWSDSMEQKFLDEHPWITLKKVVKEGDPGNEFYQGVASGTAPDLVRCSFTMMDSYIASGILEPLNKYTDSWDEWGSFTKEYIDMFTQDGNVYGIPWQVAKKINDPDKQVTGYATLAAEWTEWFFQYYVWQAGGDLTVENADGTAELTFTDPAVIEAAKYYQRLKSEGVLQSDMTLKFGDLVTNFGLGKIGMMPFAGDWVAEAVTNGINPDEIGLSLPPAGPSGEQTTAIAGECYVINASTDDAKKDAAWEYISFYESKEYFTSHFENLATKGAPNPVIIPRDDMSVTDFYEFPAEYEEVLESAKTVGRLEFYGKASFGSYVDRAVQKVLADPNADPEKEFAEVQELCRSEALETFNEENKR